MQTELSLVLHLLPFLHLFDQIDQVICLFDCYTKQISEIHRCILSQVHARKSIFRKIQFYTLHSLKWRVWANYSIARSRVLRFRLIKGHFKKIRPLFFWLSNVLKNPIQKGNFVSLDIWLHIWWWIFNSTACFSFGNFLICTRNKFQFVHFGEGYF